MWLALGERKRDVGMGGKLTSLTVGGGITLERGGAEKMDGKIHEAERTQFMRQTERGNWKMI